MVIHVSPRPQGKNKLKMFAIRIDPEQLERLQLQAELDGTSVSEVARRRLAESFALDDAIALRQEVRQAS